MTAPVLAVPVMEARDIRRHYAVGGMFGRRGTVKAVDGVTLTLNAGETLAVVGESGCGKSTLARVATLMEPPSSGELLIDGRPTADATAAERRQLRLAVQMVFQNPYGSLNPRKTLGATLEEPLAINGRGDRRARERAARAMMDRVGLRQEHYGRYPHMFSGGQRQRIAIARALMLNPRVVIADEPVSALDVSIQAQVLNLLMDLQDEFRVAYLFISHDLSVVRHIARDVLVMYLGRPVEHGPKEAIFARPRHPYTRILLSATPSVDPRHRHQALPVKGELPSPLNPPLACAFETRCPYATEICRRERPELRPLEGVRVACHHAEEIAEEERPGLRPGPAGDRRPQAPLT
ncbi:MAG: dipeptide ABC transporter ATP-binding protein [Acidisphaera sp.]|nr:dipeptide ABC transporter ATP-binding protein [Acidisphaera sp.]